MTDWLLGLVPQYGLWLLAATTFFSCLALPFPASILMLTAGGFAAAGDLVLWQAFLAAAAGGVAGLQIFLAARTAPIRWPKRQRVFLRQQRRQIDPAATDV